ncbi:MAG: hypothetical protein FVQ80_06125 [Planctomycetes bacterium]|nr:hypothetical protein [Planctomycetota bacterium]
MFVLSGELKDDIARKTGLSTDQISSMSTSAINAHLEARLSKKLPMRYPHKKLAARGSVYINTERLITPEETERKISLI